MLIDNELFFTGNLAIYEAVNRIIAEGGDGPLSFLNETPLEAIQTLVTGLRLKLLEHGKVLELLNAVANHRPASPLATNYWSTTPYALGPAAVVKYMAVCSAPRQQSVAGEDEDYLHSALAAGLDAERACFDFVAHVQTDPQLQPIEDPTVSWSAKGACEVKLATITIPTQPVPRPSTLAETIVYSPWNCLKAHVPLGKINLARKDVYLSLTATRHQQNDYQRWANVPPQERPVVQVG